MGWGSKRGLSHSQNRHSTSASCHSYAWEIPCSLALVWQVSGPELAQFVSQDHRIFLFFFFFLLIKLSKRKTACVPQHTQTHTQTSQNQNQPTKQTKPPPHTKQTKPVLVWAKWCSYGETGNVVTCLRWSKKSVADSKLVLNKFQILYLFKNKIWFCVA